MKRRVLLFLLFMEIASLPCAYAAYFRVKDALDGNTLVLENGERVRLIGVLAPQLDDKHKLNEKLAQRYKLDKKKIDEYAGISRRYVLDLIGATPVSLVYDSVNAPRHHRDKQGCRLAYVYVNVPPDVWGGGYLQSRPAEREIEREKHVYDQNGHRIFLNASILKSGHGFCSDEPRFKFRTAFQKYQKGAQGRGIGIWRGSRPLPKSLGAPTRQSGWYKDGPVDAEE